MLGGLTLDPYAQIGIVVIPALYVVFQALRERVRPSTKPATERAPAPAE